MQTKQASTMRMRFSRLLGRGQTAVIFALATVTLVGAMALGTDIAVLYFNWSQLQKAADAAVLAGATFLPNDTTKAKSTAISYAESNGVAANEINSPTFADNDLQISLSINRQVPYYFARVLGLTSGHVSVSSTAVSSPPPCTIGAPIDSGTNCPNTTSPVNPTCGGGTGQYDVLPIAVDNQTAAAWVQGQGYTLNRVQPSQNGNGPWPDAAGNWGTINLCGSSNNGGAGVRDSIADGFFGPISIKQTLQTLTGVKDGPISQGFAARIGASTDNPTNFDPSDPRAVIVPLVNFAGCNGTCQVPVTGFMAFYIDSYNSGAIAGHFVRMLAVDAIGNPTVTTDAGVSGEPILNQ